MNRLALEIQLSKVLCFTAASQNTNYCTFCERGPCKKDMSDTFLPEAKAVLDFLINQNIIKKAKLL